MSEVIPVLLFFTYDQDRNPICSRNLRHYSWGIRVHIGTSEDHMQRGTHGSEGRRDEDEEREGRGGGGLTKASPHFSSHCVEHSVNFSFGLQSDWLGVLGVADCWREGDHSALFSSNNSQHRIPLWSRILHGYQDRIHEHIRISEDRTLPCRDAQMRLIVWLFWLVNYTTSYSPHLGVHTVEHWLKTWFFLHGVCWNIDTLFID